MSRIKTFIILIIVFLIIGGYLYYKWEKESFMPSNENIIALNLEKVGKPIYINVSSTNLEQSKLCVNSPLYIDTRLLWEQTIGSNSTQ